MLKTGYAPSGRTFSPKAKKRAEEMLMFQYRHGQTHEKLTVEELAARFKEELADAERWYAELRAKEIGWIQSGADPAPEFAKNDTDRKVLEFISADTAISRPFVTNAGVPRERVEALRRAFDATMKDAEFLAEAERTKTDINPMTGEEAQKIAVATIEAPPEVRARASALMEGK